MKWALLIAFALLLCLTTSATLPQPKRVVVETVYQVFLPIVGRQIPNVRGLGLTYGHCEDLGILNIQWYYDWSPNPGCPDVESVPMVWGAGVPGGVGGNSAYLLGGNECDLDSQCNVTPTAYVPIWNLIETRFANYKLVAPVPSHLHPEWIVEFRDAYIAQYGTPPRLNVLAAHCYMWTADACVELLNWYIARANEWDIAEVWLTEFNFPTGGTRTEQQAWAEAEILINWMKQQPKIKRWAWWTNRPCGLESWCPPSQWQAPLLNTSGVLTPYGEQYRAY